MKKSRSLRPVLESLESLMLLSTATAAPTAHRHEPAMPAAEVGRVTAEATTVALHGTIRGTGTLAGTTLTVQGSGNLGQVGVASVQGSVNLENLPESVKLTTRRGALILTGTTPASVEGTHGSRAYAITGGTGAYAHATGSGTLFGSYTMLPHGKIRFSARFA